MEKTQTKPLSEVSEDNSPSKGIAWIILAFSLFITGIFTYYTKNAIEVQATNEFTYECNEIKNLVYSRLDAHAQVLWNGASFINASDSVSRSEWKIFIQQQRIDRNLPGIQGVGYSLLISKKILSQHKQSIRNEGFPKYELKPDGEREVYSSIIYLEPFFGRNLRAFGYDMYAEPIRRAAMQQACDSNNVALSGKVQLVQETSTDIQAGVLMYVPVYHQNMPVSTVAERRKALKAWVYSPYRMKDLMGGILGNQDRQIKQKMSLYIYDNDRIVPEALLFDSKSRIDHAAGNNQLLSLQLPINFNGKHWVLVFTKSTQMVSFYVSFYVLLVFIAGTSLSILIFLLALSLLNSRKRLRLSIQLTEELNESLYKQLALFNAIPDAVFVTDKESGRIEEINPKASEQYGYTRSEFDSLYRSDISLAPVPPGGNSNMSALLFNTQLHRRKDGTSFPVEITRSTFEHLNTQKIISVIRDISERVASETDLRIKNEVFENSIAAQSVSDSNGVITHVNHSFLEMWGKNEMADAIGQPVASLFADTIEAKHMLDSVNTNNSWQGEFRALRDDGSIFVSRGYTTSIRNLSGEITGYQTTNLDITQQKEAQQELLSSKEHYRKLVENANDIILVTLPDKIVFANKRFYEVLGYQADEVLLNDFERYIFPDDLKDLVENYLQLTNGGHLQNYPARIVTKNGLIKWAEFSGIVVDWDGQGAVLSFISDFTDRKLAQDALQQSEEYFRLIFEDGAIAMALVDIDFRFKQVNKAFISLFGYSAEELQALTFLDFTDPEFISHDLEGLSKLKNREISVYQTEKKYIARDQSIVWGLVRVSSMFNKNNEFLSLLVMISNITERKKAEESLLKSDEIFNQFMLNSPIYVFFKDENIRSLRLSRNFEQMLGKPLDTLLGKTMDELFPSDIAKAMIADDKRILHEGQHIEIEEEMNGRHYSTTKFPIIIDGKPVYLAGYTMDITDRKHADNLIKATLHEKEILLSEVHHRVKNNLQVVSSLLNLQANRITDLGLKDILAQSRNRIRSIALVHEKLYQSGNFAEISFSGYAQALISELFRAYLADPGEIHIKTDIEDINIPLAFAIPCGLILNEIISNCLKHAFPPGTNTGEKSEIRISLKTLIGNQLQLKISDNGIGLPDDYTVNRSSSLGLYLIQILATDQLDGKLEINNEKGTIFTITFDPFQR